MSEHFYSQSVSNLSLNPGEPLEIFSPQNPANLRLLEDLISIDSVLHVSEIEKIFMFGSDDVLTSIAALRAGIRTIYEKVILSSGVALPWTDLSDVEPSASPKDVSGKINYSRMCLYELRVKQ